MLTASVRRVHTSQIRSSIVGKLWDGRMSHHSSLAVWMNSSRRYRSTSSSNSARDHMGPGKPVRGSAPTKLSRKDLKPVSRPSLNGDDPDREWSSGR